MPGKWLIKIDKMKPILNLAFLFLYSTLFLVSCECIQTMCSDPTPFTLVDKTTQKDLVFGSNPIYFKDSIFARTTTDTFFRPVGALDSLRLYLPESDTVYLRVNIGDVDTVIVRYDVLDKTYCCKNGYAVPSSVTYNGRPAVKTNNKFLFGK
jgi:hypothetical protein